MYKDPLVSCDLKITEYVRPNFCLKMYSWKEPKKLLYQRASKLPAISTLNLSFKQLVTSLVRETINLFIYCFSWIELETIQNV